MPIKPQDRCYRTIGGVRWPNMCDVWSPDEETIVAEAKADGARIAMRKHPHGFMVAFIHPDDYAKFCAKHENGEAK